MFLQQWLRPLFANKLPYKVPVALPASLILKSDLAGILQEHNGHADVSLSSKLHV